MISTHPPLLASSPTVTPDRLQASLGVLSDLAGNTGRDTAAGLLQDILRELRATNRAPA